MHDLNDMLYFAEVVEQGGFAAASRSLGLPKSRLSRRVAALEAGLGVRLLQRTTRRVALSEAGDVFYRHCRALRESAQSATEAVAALQAEPSGNLRVVCPVTLCQVMVGEMLPRFLARYPRVSLQLEVNNRVVDLIEDGVDVALRVRSRMDASGTLVVKRLGVGRSLLVAAPAVLQRWSAAHPGQVMGPDSLGQLDSVAMSSADGRSSWELEGPNAQVLSIAHRPRYVADDLLTLKYAVLAGTGAGWLPDYMCLQELADGRLVEALPGWASAQPIVHAVFPSRRGLLPVVRSFLDFLAEEFERVGDGTRFTTACAQ